QTNVQNCIVDSQNDQKYKLSNIRLNNSQNKRHDKTSNLTYFDINEYDGQHIENESQLKKFSTFHCYGSILQLTHNNEIFLRKNKV
ncbi:hypothetical protein PFDG_05282, partial [Plasmodium falciparum Dd2]